MTGISKADLKEYYDTTMTNMFKTLIAEVAQAEDNPAFQYGATYDDLSRVAVEYVVPPDKLMKAKAMLKVELKMREKKDHLETA